MNNLSNKILEKIKTENVRPKPRWYFILMHTLIALAIIFSIVIGSLAVAIIIRHFAWTDWELARQYTGGHIRSFFLLLPYLWVVFIILAIFLADHLFKHTKKGHRIKPWIMIIASVLLSTNFGYIFYLAKLDRPIEATLKTNMPYYEVMEKQRNKLFAAPELGILAGEIKAINSANEWVVLDFRNHEWVVYTGDARFKNSFEPAPGIQIGMMGKVTEKDYFKAKVIGLWKLGLTLPIPPSMEFKIEKFERNF